jgi:hypothetical protein
MLASYQEGSDEDLGSIAITFLYLALTVFCLYQYCNQSA